MAAPASHGGDLVGRTLGDFVVEDKLGEGGFGAVYRARQTLLDREAVIKVLHTRLRAAGVVTERFLREARLASRLDHPYAAHIYAFGAEPDGTFWLAMELVRGTTLTEYLRANGKLTLDRFIPLLERICEVIHTAHEQGIVHRDIKPANVMVVSRAGRLLPKLLDFGIAKAIFDVPGAPVARPSVRELPSYDRAALADTLGPEGTRDTLGSTFAPSTDVDGPPLRDSELTLEGTLIGSPHYMAPEQWQDAASVDRRTDLYALGVLSYEALTGTRPFTGEAIAELALAHEHGQIAPVPAPLPRALDDVFRRALAHDPADRFATALEMATAFRDAAGLSDPKPLPHLDDAVRERYLAEAPQLLAEPIAALEAARTPRQARDALWQCVGSLARYLGIVALAAKSRMDTAGDGPAALGALRRAGTELLAERDWLELAGAFVRSHAERPDLHPVPELVLFVGGKEPGPGLRRFRELWAMRDELADAAADDDAMRARLSRALAIVSSLLRDAAFVCDYPLVLPVEDGDAERWVGVRRSARTSQPIRGSRPPAGRAILIDAHGTPVLALHPLVQMLPPSPGADPEVFLYTGRAERGAKLVAPPFEYHDEAVLEWLRLQMSATLDPAERGPADERPPYRGLEAFTADDAQFFFGRERLVDGFVNRLRVQPLLVVVGRSGSGKSSFVQAGVIPALGADWRTIVMRPGTSPMTTLRARLAQLGIDELPNESLVESQGARVGKAIAQRIHADAIAHGAILLVVDQLEELFTLTTTDDERLAFASALANIARTSEDRVRVVLTLRDDFLVRAETLPGLRDRLVQGLQLLGMPGRDDLARILVEPARRAGYQFEDPALVERMVAEVANQPGALALLSFTASRMWEHRDRHFRRMSRRAYEALGGVGGALAHHAEALLEAMPPNEQRLVRDAFRHLVTSEGTRAVRTRAELAAVLGRTEAGDAVIERLVASRLLVASEGEADEQIEIAHEALLDAWPRLVTWRREDAEGARMRDQIRDAAKQWDARSRPRGLLWRDDALAEYKRWRERHPGELGPIETEFASASLREAARGKLLRRGLTAAAFTVLAIGLVVLFQMQRRAEDARGRAAASAQQAQSRLLELRIEQGRQALLGKDSMRALAYFSSAYSAGARGSELQFMIARATADLDTQEGLFEHGSGEVLEVAFARGGKAIVTVGEDGAYVWDAATRKRIHTLHHEARVWSISVSSDGRQLATGSRDRTVKLWNAETGALVHTLAHPAPVRLARFSPDGTLVATSCADKLVRLWSTTTGKQIAELAGHAEHARELVFDATGQRLLSASIDRTARIWSVPGGALLANLNGHTNWVWAARFSPDGKLVATASLDRSVRIWDASTGRELRSLKHFHRVGSVEFSPDGQQLLTASDDHRSTLWSVATGDPILTFIGHTDYVTAALFSPDAKQIVTFSADHNARLWDAHTGALLNTFVGHSQTVTGAAFDATGERIVTSSADGTARLWNARARQVIVALDGERGDRGPVEIGARALYIPSTAGRPSIRSASTGAVERRLELGDGDATWSGDGTRVAIVDAAGVRAGPADALVRLPDTTGATQTWLSHDGGRLVIAFDGRPAELWSLAEPRRIAALPGQDATTFATFSPEGQLLATTHDNGSVELWTASGTLQRRFPAHDQPISHAAWSADGKRFATASNDKSARIWSIATGQLDVVLQGHTDVINSIAFHPTLELVVTGSEDSTAKIWSSRTGALVFSYLLEGSAGWVGWAADGERLVALRTDPTQKLPPNLQVWQAKLDQRTPAELAAFVGCRVPLVFDGEQLVPTRLPPCE